MQLEDVEGQEAEAVVPLEAEVEEQPEEERAAAESKDQQKSGAVIVRRAEPQSPPADV